MTVRGKTTTYVYFDTTDEAFAVRVSTAAHSDHLLTIEERHGCDLHFFLTDGQLRQVLAAINARLGLVSRPAEATP